MAPACRSRPRLAVDKPQLFSDFDLLGFDPRGFGASTPLQCLTTAEALNALPVTPDYKERNKLTHKVEVAEAKLQADACSATEFGQFVSSQQTVYDMDFLRALFKARQLNFIGYSYGTWLGGWYSDTYPARVGRFVLDSNMDWTHTQWDNVNFDPFSGQRRRDTQLFPWIARHADQITGLGKTPAQVLAKLQRDPRVADHAGQGRRERGPRRRPGRQDLQRDLRQRQVHPRDDGHPGERRVRQGPVGLRRR